MKPIPLLRWRSTCLVLTCVVSFLAVPIAAVADPLPAPWLNQDIGAPGAEGTADFASDVFTVQGSGVDIWSIADQFHFVYQPLTGDGTIIAHVVSQDDTNQWAKAGVMIRETLAADSRFVDMLTTPQQGLAFQYRENPATDTIHIGGDLVPAPYWVKLVRSGDDFSGYASPDGVDWTLVGSVSIPMTADVFVGLPVCSHNDGTLGTAVFDGVSVTGGADLTIQVTAIPDPVVPGSKVAYTLSVTNAGPADATGVSVTNLLPPGTTLQDAIGDGLGLLRQRSGDLHPRHASRRSRGADHDQRPRAGGRRGRSPTTPASPRRRATRLRRTTRPRRRSKSRTPRTSRSPSPEVRTRSARASPSPTRSSWSTRGRRTRAP